MSRLPRRTLMALAASMALGAAAPAAAPAQQFTPPPPAGLPPAAPAAGITPDYSLLTPGGRNEPAVLPRERQTIRSAQRVDLRRTFARLPLFRARVGGDTVWYVLTDVSDAGLAERMGLNFSPRLSNLITPDCPGCVQTVREGSRIGQSVIERPGAPDFSPDRLLVPGPNGGFPPRAARAGAVGDPEYSPHVRVAGTNIVFNAPIVATGTGRFDLRAHDRTHDRLVGIDTRRRTVDMNFIRAFAFGRDIMYLSFESSSAATAVLDRSTFVPGLGLSPAPDRSRDPMSARSTIVTFTNGQRGATSPPGQGNDHVIVDGLNPRPLDLRDRRLIEALRIGGDAHNVLDSFPTLRDPAARNLYSPLWDVNVGVWSDDAVARGLNVAQTDVNQIRQLAARGLVTSPGGGRFASDRSILNCPALAFLTVAPEADQVPPPPQP